MKRNMRMFAVALLVIYITGYFLARRSHALVHYMGYHTVAAERRIYEHAVRHGGLRDNRAPGIGNQMLFIAFTPLRWLEVGYWCLVLPHGAPWPHD